MRPADFFRPHRISNLKCVRAPASRMGNFRVQVTCPVVLSEDHTAGLMRSVHHCLVHNTLLSSSEIKIELVAG